MPSIFSWRHCSLFGDLWLFPKGLFFLTKAFEKDANFFRSKEKFHCWRGLINFSPKFLPSCVRLIFCIGRLDSLLRGVILEEIFWLYDSYSGIWLEVVFPFWRLRVKCLTMHWGAIFLWGSSYFAFKVIVQRSKEKLFCERSQPSACFTFPKEIC